MLGKKETCYLGITDKTRKDLLIKLIDEFKTTKLSIDEGVLSLSFALLRSNNLIDFHWKTNLSYIDMFIM
jgi:hypothetical protein